MKVVEVRDTTETDPFQAYLEGVWYAVDRQVYGAKVEIP